MHINEHTERLLDDLMRNNISREEAIKKLSEEGIADPEALILSHETAVKLIQRRQVAQQVQSVHQSFIQENAQPSMPSGQVTAKVIRMNPMHLLIRAAAMLIGIAATWLAYQYINTNNSGIYTELYQSYHVNTERSSASPVEHRMVEDFRNQQYEAVVSTFEKLTETNNREKFLAANAYISLNRGKESVLLFQDILDANERTGSKLYQDEAEYYLALAYLKTGQNKAALALFKKIRQQPGHTYQDKIDQWTITRLQWITK